MAVVAKILQALAAIIPLIAEWWAKRKAAQDKASVEARNADIRDEPGPEWVHKFDAADQQHSEQQPDSDNQTSAKQPDSAPEWWNKHG